jgi:phosphomannomutase
MQRYGYYSTGQISIRVTDLSVIKNLMSKLRDNPPTEIAGANAVFTDLAVATEALPATDGLRFDLSDGRRVIVRPSGTEPKLKCYLQAVADSDQESKKLLAELDAAMREILS